MASPGFQPVWLPDEIRQLWYYVHPQDGARIYQDGTRIPQSPRVLPQTPPARLPAQQQQPWTSPPTANSNFMLRGQNSTRSPDGASADATAGSSRGLHIGEPTTSPYQQQATRPQVPAVIPTVAEVNGIRTVTAQDPTSRVTTYMGTGPAERITDPALYGNGIRATRALYGTTGDEEQLFSAYRIRDHRFFCVGRVFLILWSEPAGETSTTIESVVPNDRSMSGISSGPHNEYIYSKVRRFVVIRPGHNYCSALPVMSYGHQGVGKPGVVKAEHGIIYTGSTPPEPSRSERPGRSEPGMRTSAIRVTPDERGTKLDSLSRIDYAKVHTIHHNIKVAPFGVVHPNSMEALDTQWRNVWLENIASGPGTSAPPSMVGRPRSQRTGSVGSSSAHVRNMSTEVIREEPEDGT
ncbi:hypothetical protein LTR22_018750 [Elasticomyces elasticus]|nr:hypothetical protein LTR22_018750 [Elasticomyces elasticus]KAK5756169.1 hypothetical protein LTS12_013722 [Elasticomyces elasticus]